MRTPFRACLKAFPSVSRSLEWPYSVVRPANHFQRAAAQKVLLEKESDLAPYPFCPLYVALIAFSRKMVRLPFPRPVSCLFGVIVLSLPNLGRSRWTLPGDILLSLQAILSQGFPAFTVCSLFKVLLPLCKQRRAFILFSRF